MITREQFLDIISELQTRGWATEDIIWSQTVSEPENANDFATEAIFVICNSGMRFTVARTIFGRVMDALHSGVSAATAFGHEGKTAAMDAIWRRRDELFGEYLASADKVEFLSTLPWIGGITKWHLAKNLGLDVVKPDVHLVRLAAVHRTDPDTLCRSLAAQTGYRAATVDTLIWRACAVGVIDSRTGEIRLAA